MPSWMGEHEVSWEYMENKENIENIKNGEYQPDALKHSLFEWKHQKKTLLWHLQQRLENS